MLFMVFLGMSVKSVAGYEYETYTVYPDGSDASPIKNIITGDRVEVHLEMVHGEMKIQLVDEANYALHVAEKDYETLLQTELSGEETTQWKYTAPNGDDLFVIVLNEGTESTTIRVIQYVYTSTIWILSYVGIGLSIALGFLVGIVKMRKPKADTAAKAISMGVPDDESVTPKEQPKNIRVSKLDKPMYQWGRLLAYTGELLITIQGIMVYLSLPLIATDDLQWMVFIPAPFFLIIESYIYLLDKHRVR